MKDWITPQVNFFQQSETVVDTGRRREERQIKEMVEDR
jgi:hypothetical protein